MLKKIDISKIIDSDEEEIIDFDNLLSTPQKESKWLKYAKEGNIPKGLAIGSEDFDFHYRMKERTMLGIFGIDNVGKTTFYIFLACCIARKYNKNFLLIVQENEAQSIRQTIMEVFTGKYLHQCSDDLVKSAELFAYKYFDIVDDKTNVTKDNIFSILDYLFKEKSYYGVFLDPYNAIQYSQTPNDNYKFLDSLRQYQNKKNTSFHISMHISTDKARNYVYREKDTIDDFSGNIVSVDGQPKIPRKNFVEGGQPIANKLDDIMIVHRLMKMDELRSYMLISIDKVKETRTGGMVSFETPIMFKKEHGFVSYIDKLGVNPLNGEQVMELPKTSLEDAFDLYDEDGEVKF